jgi:hypothetical protein
MLGSVMELDQIGLRCRRGKTAPYLFCIHREARDGLYKEWGKAAIQPSEFVLQSLIFGAHRLLLTGSGLASDQAQGQAQAHAASGD